MITHLTFNGKLTIEQIQESCDNHIAHTTGGEVEGTPTPIRVVQKGRVAADINAAQIIIEAEDYGYYDSMAIKFVATEERKPAVYEATLEEVEKLQKKYNELQEPHFEEFKSKLISCKRCGSKLSTKHLAAIFCPLCGQDLRPQTTIEREQKIFERWEKKKEKLALLESKGKDKPTTHKVEQWLVKIEY